MKFTQEFCPVCAANDLEVYNSMIDYANDPAIGYIYFICNGCGHEFEVIKEAEVNT